MQNLQPYYTASEVYAERFYQLPQVFFTSDLYRGLSNDAKVAFTLLKSRFDVSVRNGWIDDNGHIYFTYTNKSLMQLLGCRSEKLAKIKKELITAELLSQVRVGVNQPNRLYLHKPVVTSNDIYSLSRSHETQAQTDTGSSKTEHPENAANSGNSKIEHPDKSRVSVSQNRATSGDSKIEHNLERPLDTSTRDLLETKDSKSDISKEDAPETSKTLERELLKHFADSIDDKVTGKILSRESLRTIGSWSHTVKEARNRVGIVLNAKRDAELEWDVYLLTEDLQEKLSQTLTRVILRWKDQLDGRGKHGKIENIDNYLYSSMKAVFDDAAVNQLHAASETPSDDAKISELVYRFSDPDTGKQARLDARKLNKAKRTARMANY